jgi:hypothetical protein
MKKNKRLTFVAIITIVMFLAVTSLLYLGYNLGFWSKPLFWAIIVLGYWATIAYCMLLSAIKSE